MVYPFLIYLIWIQLKYVYNTEITSPGNEDILEQREILKQQISMRKQWDENSDIIDINKYTNTIIEPSGYKINLIVDPCRGHSYDCCQDAYGSPTYIVPGSDKKSDLGIVSLVDEFNKPIPEDISRLADTNTMYDSHCFINEKIGPYRRSTILNNDNTTTTIDNYNDDTCMGRLSSLIPHSVNNEKNFPVCWDWNNSVNSLQSCYTVDGIKKNNCVTVGYMQNNYIVQCYGIFALDNHCGTFLEVHKEGDETILSQTRLLAEYSSGYRTTTLPLFYKGNKLSVVCRGPYEIWWVQRTKYGFIIQFKKKFYVEEPTCDFDSVANLYIDYHSMSLN